MVEGTRWESGLDLIFHAEALALDDHGFGVVKKAIE